MTLERATITHKLEATGRGELTASTLTALAALVPTDAAVAFEQQGPSVVRRFGGWSWVATWPYGEQPQRAEAPGGGIVEIGAPAVVGDFPSTAELLAAYDAAAIHIVGTLDGTNDPRCLVVSDARVERFGYAVGVQCELQLGHSPLRNGAGHKFAKKTDQ